MTSTRLTAHDHFVRNMMAKKMVAQEFFEQHLPKRIKKLVQLDTLQLQSDSFVDDELKKQMADLLYKVQFGNQEGYLFLLLEHQSSPDKWMAFRLLKYSIAIMERHLKQTKAKILPIVYPMLLYNGKQKYNYSKNLFDLFGKQKELAENILFTPFHLIDLKEIPDQQLKEYFWAGVLTQTLKHIYAKDMLPFIEASLIKDFQIIEKRGKEGYIYVIVQYISKAGEIKNKEKFFNLLEENLSEKTVEGVMTIAQALRQEGRQTGIEEGFAAGEARGKIIGIAEGEVRGKIAGIAEGEIEAMKKMALKLLQRGLPLDQIMQLTELSAQEIEEIKKQN